MPTQQVFALSIDNDLRWATAFVEERAAKRFMKMSEDHSGIFCALPKSGGLIDLHELIDNQLNDLSMKRIGLFDDVKSFGVSTVGIVDRDRRQLANIDRRKWKRHDNRFIVDFDLLARKYFKNAAHVGVQNDATAKGQAEIAYLSDVDRVDSIFYAMFNEGVNGSFVQAGGDLAASAAFTKFRHQELGHALPQLHPHDLSFSQKNPSCRIHSDCYVSLAGGHRILSEWGTDDSQDPGALLYSLKHHKDDPWDIYAHYVATFCWSAFLAVPPKRILIAGDCVFPDLLKLVRAKFDKLNKDKDHRYIDYGAMEDGNFISMARFSTAAAGILGALEIARKALPVNWSRKSGSNRQI